MFSRVLEEALWIFVSGGTYKHMALSPMPPAVGGLTTKYVNVALPLVVTVRVAVWLPPVRRVLCVQAEPLQPVLALVLAEKEPRVPKFVFTRKPLYDDEPDSVTVYEPATSGTICIVTLRQASSDSDSSSRMLSTS
jgi:hypothetical protein